MADDKTQPRQADRSRVNVQEDYELDDWSRRFGVSRDEIKRVAR